MEENKVLDGLAALLKTVCVQAEGATVKVKRDRNIEKNYKREINISTRSINSKKVYSRKTKHKLR